MTVSVTMQVSAQPWTDFVAFIRLFKHNHGHAALKEGARLDTHVLQFLVLSNMWLQTRTEGLREPESRLATEMQRNFRRDQAVNQFFRYFWLKKREHMDFEDAVGSSNVRRTRNPQLCLADHLLPSFMHLSCKMQPPDSNLDMKWMELASNFMVHAAIEILDAPDLFEDGIEVAEIALRECFAWGYVERRRFQDNAEIVQRLLNQIESKSSQPQITLQSLDQCRDHIQSTTVLEDEVWEMFYDEGSSRARTTSDGHTTPQSSGELSHWTSIRQEKLNAVLTTFATMQEANSIGRHHPIERLRNKYRLSAFLAEVAYFIEVHWKKVHRSEWRGKPVLVQIDEGGLDGLSPEAFVSFKRRARIADQQWFIGSTRQ